MRTEAEACAQEAARLDQAAAKLHALSAELETRRAALLKAREVEAAEETARRWRETDADSKRKLVWRAWVLGLSLAVPVMLGWVVCM